MSMRRWFSGGDNRGGQRSPAAKPDPQPAAAKDRVVRVFISSTFGDMQAERDHLVRIVFPKLREELLKLRIRLVDVDLRWEGD